MFFWQAGFGFLLLELFVFMAVIAKIGFFKTFALWLLSAAFGGWLVQKQGLATMMRVQDSFNRKAVPVEDVFKSICLFIAGLLFIFPGFISDILAFFLLIPFIRNMLREKGPNAFGYSAETFKSRDDGVIDGSYVRVEDTVEQIERNSEDKA